MAVASLVTNIRLVSATPRFLAFEVANAPSGREAAKNDKHCPAVDGGRVDGRILTSNAIAQTTSYRNDVLVADSWDIAVSFEGGAFVE